MSTPLAPTTRIETGAAEQRSPHAMQQDDAARQAPQFPAAPQAETPVSVRRVKPFLPMMDAGQYADYKARPRPKTPFAFLGKDAALRAVGLTPAAPLTVNADFDGAGSVDGEAPPDTHGAIGAEEFVEVTNSHVDVYQKSSPNKQLSHTSHAAFFGYYAQGLFDARAVYDGTWNRWIITADAFPESADVQRYLVAISTTPSATDPFWVYALTVTFASGDFWDFPQVGLDQDSVIVTANVFDASGNPKGADLFAVAKARLYNGLGFSVPVFTGLVGTLAPPVVLDSNTSTFLIAAPPSGDALQLYTLRDSSTTGINLTGPQAVPVDSYTMPPPAPQPGLTDPTDSLDTGDSRFVNASTQVGDSLWQTHTIDLVGYAAPKFYQVNTATAAVEQSSFYFATSTSYDFNASIAANSAGDMFVTWNTTDPPAGTNVQVRFAGCDHAAGPAFPGAGSALVTSDTAITGDFDPRFGMQRWGDYSAVTLDPADSRQAWLVNEKTNDANTWGSQIGAVSL